MVCERTITGHTTGRQDYKRGSHLSRTIESIRVGDIPSDVYQSINEFIQRYSVCLLGTRQSRNGSDSFQLGSGTFVRVGNDCFILTADHVVKSGSFRNSERLGFAIMGDVHQHSLAMSVVGAISVGECGAGADGPDLALIQLPNDAIGWIRAFKSFWPLDGPHSEEGKEFERIGNGVWAIAGCPAEYTVEGPALIPGFERSIGLYGLCGFSGVQNETMRKGFDYLEFPVAYDSQSDPPSSFKGVSGGGLWQVLLSRGPAREVLHSEPILSGVAFFESPVSDDEVVITCHGRSSIYRSVVHHIRDSAH